MLLIWNKSPNDRSERHLFVSGSTDLSSTAKHLFHMISQVSGVKSNCLPQENIQDQ